MSAVEGQLALDGLAPESGPTPTAADAKRSSRREVFESSRRAFVPTAEQAAAIASRERDAFLEAGAGSGKTTVLVDRYVAAIAEDGVEVDRILAFTFTERAAAEMRTR